MAPATQHLSHSAVRWFLLECWFFLSATAEAFVITPTSPNTFYGDFNISPAMTAAYSSFTITNDNGTPATDLWVTLGGFSGGVLGLAPLEDGAFHLGDLAAGASGTAFFYLNATGASASPQSYSVCIHSASPAAAPLACSDLSFSSVQDTIRAGNSSVDGVILSIEVDPNPPTLGGTFSMTVQGRTGTLGAAEVLAFSPASTPDWPADCYELYASEIHLQSPNQGSLYDWLYVPPPLTSTVATNYTVVYSFRVVCAPAAAVEVLPATYVSSGNVVKHADVGDLGVVIYPAVPPASPTSTSTPTRTDTATRTDTVTRSATPSSTATGTETQVPPLSDTDTPTRTASPTPTSTRTSTSTATFSRTATSTSTKTATLTDTASSTLSPSPTASSTPSSTATSTSSDTSTPTETPTWTFSHTPTATPTLTVTVTSTSSPTLTASATPTLSPTSTATQTSTPSPTQSASNTVTPSITQTSTSTASPSQTLTFTDSPTSTVSPTFSASPTPRPPSVSLTLKIYNSAGELVAVLAQGMDIPAGFSGLGTPSEALVPDLGGQGGALSLLGTDMALNWDGKNSGGQSVDSGSYTAVADVTDSFGKVTTYSSGFSVLRLPAELKVSVYNSAGELVYQVLKPAPAVIELNELDFSTGQLLLGDGQPKLEIRYSSGPERITWDGHNSQGQLVSQGLYMVKVEVSQPGQAPSIIVKAVQVLRAPGGEPLATAYAAPNPAGPGDRRIRIFLDGIDPALAVKAQFYNLAGERVASADNLGHPAHIEWDLDGMAPGVYFAVLETKGDLVQRKVIKMAVKR